MEEDKKETANNLRKRKQSNPTGITDPRSASRIKFITPSLIDPRVKLSNQQIEATNDRRKKIIKENRSKRMEADNKDEEEKSDKKTEKKKIKELFTMVKQMMEALKQFEDLTRLEIDNIIKTIKRN